MTSEFVNQMVWYIQEKTPLIIISGKDHTHIRNELCETARALNQCICFWKNGARFEDPITYRQGKKTVISVRNFLSSVHSGEDFDEDSIDSIIDELFSGNQAVNYLIESSDADDVVKWFDKKVEYDGFIQVVEDKGEAFTFCSTAINEIGNKDAACRKTLILLLPLDDTDIPETGEYGVYVLGPTPDLERLQSLYLDVRKENNMKLPEVAVQKSIVNVLKGCTLSEARNLLSKVIRTYGRLGSSELKFLQTERYSKVPMSDVLTFIPASDDMVYGGCEALKQWISDRKNLTSEEAAQYGLTPPKGVLLVGPPGTGKSIAARMISDILCRPLFSFNVDALFQRLVGVGEEKTRKALSLIDTLGDVVLFIDEVEKIMGGTQAGGKAHESTIRLLGMLMTWLSDRKSSAFVIATSNNLLTLPPEFSRKGRFDEVFCVDLPALKEREEILSLHLKKRNQHLEPSEISEIAKLTVGASGSELVELIQSAMIQAFHRRTPLTFEDLQTVALQTPPLARRRPEEILLYRSWSSQIGIPASLEKSDFEIEQAKEEEMVIPEWDDRAYQ